MASNPYIGISLGMDISPLKSALNEAKQEMQLADSEFKARTGGLERWNDTAIGVAEKLNAMATELSSKKKIVEAYRQELERVREEYGENSAQAKKVETALNNAEASYKKAQTYTKNLKSELEKLTTEDELAKTGAENLKSAVFQLQGELDAQRSITEQAREQLELIVNTYGDASKEAKDYAKVVDTEESKLETLETTLDSYRNALDKVGDETDETTNQTNQFKSSLGNVDTASGGLVSGGLEKLKNKLTDIAKNGFGQVISAVKNFVKETIQIGMTFSATMSEVQAMSGATAEEMELLESTARQYGATTVFSATQAAEALKYMALAGWDTEQSASALGGILDLAAAGSVDLAKASDIVTDYLASFNLTAAESGKMADIMAYAQSHANTTVEALGEAYKNSATLLTGYGQPIERTTALLAILANNGIKGGEAGTALNSMFRDMVTHMKDGKIAIGDVSVSILDEEDNFRSLIDIIDEVNTAVAGLGSGAATDAINDTFKIFSQKAISIFAREGTDTLRDFEQQLINSGGTAREISEIMTDNLAGDKKALDSAIEDLQLRLYDILEGPLRGITQFLTEAIPVIIRWGEDAYNVFNGIYEALGPLWEAFGALWDWISQTVGTAWSEMSETIDNAKEGANNIITAAEDAYNGLCDAFDGAGQWASDTYDSITGAFDGAGQWFKDKFDASWQNITEAFTDPAGWAEGIWEDISGGFGDIAGWFSTEFGNGWQSLKDAFPDVTGWAEEVWNNITTAFNDPIGWASGIGENIRDGLKSGWDTASGLLSGAWNSIKTAFNDAFTWAGNVADSIRNGLKTGWEMAKSLLSGAWNAVKSGFNDAVTWAGGVADSIRTGLKSGWEYASGLLSSAWSKVKTAFGDAYSWAEGIAETIRSGLKSGWEYASTLLSSVWSSVKTAFNDAYTWAGGIAGSIRNGLKSGWEYASSLLTGAWANVKSAFADPVGWASGIAESMRTGLKSGWDTIKDAFSGIWSKITGAFGNPVQTFTNLFSGVYDAITQPFNGIVSFFEGIYNNIVKTFQPILAFFGIRVESDYEKKKKQLQEQYSTELANRTTAWDNYVRYYNAGSYSLANAEYGKWQQASKAVSEANRALSQLEAEHRAEELNGISGIPDSISNAFSGLSDLISSPFKEAFNIITDTFGGIGDWFSENVVTPVADAVSDIPPEVTAGLALGLTQAANSSPMTSGIVVLGESVYNAFKDTFDIHSPSRLMRDKIGLMIGAGIAEGIEDSADMVRRASESLSGFVEIGDSGTGYAGAPQIVYNQTINSPSPLSAGAIYRDTKTLIGRRGWLA